MLPPKLQIVGPAFRVRHSSEHTLALCVGLRHDLNAIMEREGRIHPLLREFARRMDVRVLEIQDSASATWSSNEQVGRPLDLSDRDAQEVPA